MSLWGVALIAIVLQKDINHLNFSPMTQVTVYIRSHYAVKQGKQSTTAVPQAKIVLAVVIMLKAMVLLHSPKVYHIAYHQKKTAHVTWSNVLIITHFHLVSQAYILNLVFENSSVKHQTVMINNITSHNNMNHSSVKHETVMVNNITCHNNMNHSSVKHETVMVNNITCHNNMNHSSVKPSTVMANNITSHINTNHSSVKP